MVADVHRRYVSHHKQRSRPVLAVRQDEEASAKIQSVYGVAGRLAAPLTSRSTWRRWVHLIMGGALLMPYMILGQLLLGWVSGAAATSTFAPRVLAVVVPLAVPAAAVTPLFIPAVRMVEGTAAKELLGGRAAALTVGNARSWPDRWRSAGWFVLHLLFGGVVSALTLSMPPLAAVLLAEPFADFGALVPRAWDTPLAPVAGVALLVGLVYLAAGTGELLARLAPVLLGPSPQERLAELERRAGRLAERNRLARELHDSVGHALTTATLQAGAASRLLDSDPEFVRRALAAIEETGRAAAADLDHVLGLLRDGSDGAHGRAPQPTLSDMDELLASTRSAGLTIDADLTGELGRVSAAVSREAYRIVQEALTNVLRHAGKVPVAVRLAVEHDGLELEVSNPIGAARAQRIDRGGGSGRDRNGGRGLQGIRERVGVLRGEMSAAADGDHWRVVVRLPLGTRP